MKEKSKNKIYVVTFVKFILLGLFTYSFMVIISHFSVYKETSTYKFSDSISALVFKTDVPVMFFVYFGILLLSVIIIAILIRFLLNLVKK